MPEYMGEAARMAALEDEMREEQLVDDYAKDTVCPKCGSRVKVDKKAGMMYCASGTCNWMKEIVGW